MIRDLDAERVQRQAVDHRRPDRRELVYAVWDRLVFPASERASVDAGVPHRARSAGPTWFARSDERRRDLGAAARQIYDPGQNDQTIGNQIVVLPNGTLVDIFTEFHNENAKKQRGGSVRVMRSTDKGDDAGRTPFLIDRSRTIGVTDPETGDDVRTGDIIPDIAVAPNGDAVRRLAGRARSTAVGHDSDRVLAVDRRRAHLVDRRSR